MSGTLEKMIHRRQPDSPFHNQHPINVLHIIGSLQVGGAENQVVTLVQALNNARYTVDVCCLIDQGKQAPLLESQGINVFALNMRLRYWPLAAFKLYRLMKRLDIKIVHAHLYESGIWGRLVGKLAGVPVFITTEHGMTLWKKRRHVVVEGFANRFTDKMLAVSEDIRQRRIKHQNVPPEKIITLPNAVNIERFTAAPKADQIREQLGLDPSAPVIGTVARLVPPKRLDYLLETAAIVCQTIPKARFVIIGDGPLRQSLENQAQQLGLLPDKIQFLGSRQDIPKLLAMLDIFTLSSEREGLPVSLLEAMAASKPVVVTSVGGIPEIIEHRHNGLLVPPHNPAALAESIVGLIQNQPLREKLAAQGHQTIKAQYSVTAIAQRIIDLYDEILNSKQV